MEMTAHHQTSHISITHDDCFILLFLPPSLP